MFGAAPGCCRRTTLGPKPMFPQGNTAWRAARVDLRKCSLGAELALCCRESPSVFRVLAPEQAARCLWRGNRGLSGVLVSYIRLAGEDFNDNLGAGRITNSHPFVQAALDDISRRAGSIEVRPRWRLRSGESLKTGWTNGWLRRRNPAPIAWATAPKKTALLCPCYTRRLSGTFSLAHLG